MKASQVKPNWTRQLLMAVFLVLATGAVLWLEYQHKPQQEQRKEADKKMFYLKDKQIASIRLETKKGTTEFKCLDLATHNCKAGDTSKWELVEPKKLQADDANVGALLSSLGNLDSNESIDLNIETPEKRTALLKEYKLDPSSLKHSDTESVEIKIEGGQALSMHLGDTHPLGDSIFASKGDPGRVYLVPTYIRASINKELSYWRDKKLLSVVPTLVRKFEYQGSHLKVTAEKKNGQWSLEVLDHTSRRPSPPQILAGDIESIDNFLASVAYLNAKSFESDNRADAHSKKVLHGAKPIVQLTLETEPTEQEKKEAKTYSVQVSFYEKRLKGLTKNYATVSDRDPLYEMENGIKARFDKELKDFRLSRLIASMERFSAKKLTFTGKGIEKEITLSLNQGKWTDTSGRQPPEAIDQDKVQSLLEKLSTSKIKSFLNEKSAPKGESTGVTMTLFDEKGDAKRKLVFWKMGEALYSRDLLLKRPDIFALETGIGSVIPWSSSYLIKK